MLKIGANPGDSHRALQHGRRPNQPARPGGEADGRQPGRDRAGALRGRRGGQRLGARRQPARGELAAGHRRLRPRLRHHHL